MGTVLYEYHRYGVNYTAEEPTLHAAMLRAYADLQTNEAYASVIVDADGTAYTHAAIRSYWNAHNIEAEYESTH